jgi:plastocyanin
MKSNKIFTGKFFLVWMLAISLVAVVNGCKKDDNSPASSGTPPANEVWMQSNAFNPSSITVSAGTTITWRNKDSAAHTVTSNNGGFTSSSNISGGGTYSFQFMTAGTYPYHCTIHSGMTGQVVVQ